MAVNESSYSKGKTKTLNDEIVQNGAYGCMGSTYSGNNFDISK